MPRLGRRSWYSYLRKDVGRQDDSLDDRLYEELKVGGMRVDSDGPVFRCKSVQHGVIKEAMQTSCHVGVKDNNE